MLHFFVWEQNIHDLVASHAHEREGTRDEAFATKWPNDVIRIKVSHFRLYGERFQIMV